jgi:hypothetical protein
MPEGSQRKNRDSVRHRLSLENLVPTPCRLNRQRDLIRNLQPVTFQRYHFARMIRKHAYPPQSEID